MLKHFVPITMVAAVIAFAVSAATVGMLPNRPAWWPAALSLLVLGGVTPLIYAVNIRIVPVFARRRWQSERLLRIQLAAILLGAWLVYLSRLASWQPGLVAGQAAGLLSSLLFMVNVVRLFRQPAAGIGLPLPFPEQGGFDRIAVQLTRFAGMALQLGMILGVVLAVWTPETGRWDLVWAHLMLIGFFLSMAMGVCYHVLPRWGTGRWPMPWLQRPQFFAHAVALPLMLVALATDTSWLFRVSGPLMALAIAAFLVQAAPLLPALPRETGLAFGAAMGALAMGVALGAMFAIDPAAGARLRLVHAEFNLFGWTGLLVMGAATYLAPRFSGRPMRWPALLLPHVGLQVLGVLLGVLAFTLRAGGDDATTFIWIAQGVIAASFALLALHFALTFTNKPGQAMAAPIIPRCKGVPRRGTEGARRA